MEITPLHNAPQTTAPAPVSLSAEEQAENSELVQAVHAINAAELYGEQNELTLALERRTRRPMMRLIDRRTGRLIREVSPDEVRREAARLPGSDAAPESDEPSFG